MIIDKITVRPNDTVDFWFSEIRNNLTIKGMIECPECSAQKVYLENLTSISRPSINIHILKSGHVTFDNFVKESDADLTLKIRDLTGLTFIDSYFASMPMNSMEMFNVPDVLFMHSEFHHSSPGFMVCNSYVKNVTIVDCLMEDNAISVLEPLENRGLPSTNITKKCTISPTDVAAATRQTLGPECQNSVIGRWVDLNAENPGVETSGAIALAIISAAILMTVVLALYTLHRQGKLDRYL